MTILRDLRYATRRVLQTPAFSLTVVVTLSIAIGANAALFGIVNALFLRPLPNRNPDQLLYVQQTAPGIGIADAGFSVPEIRDFRERARTVSALGTFSAMTFTAIGLVPNTLNAALVGVFAMIGLVIAGVGIAGLTTYSVSRRTREFGTRLAIGATAANVTWLVLKEATLICAAGVALGGAGAVIMAKIVQGTLYGVATLDAPSYVGAAVALIVVVIGATVGPARLASRVSPVAALHHE